jgi:excisionase family DNA binding protein
MQKRLLTLPEAAGILGISDQRVYALARENILPVVRLGRKVRIDVRQLDIFIERGGQALPGGWKREEK